MAAKKKEVKKTKPVQKKAPVVEKEPEVGPKETYEGPICTVCGAPVAPGQTYVCIDHQRTN